MAVRQNQTQSSSRGRKDTELTSFGVYMRDVAEHSVMKPEKELAAARAIAQARRTYWKALLSYPPFIDGITTLVEEVLANSELPTEALADLRKASRDYRDRETKVNRDRFEGLRDALSMALAEIDVDGVASGRVAADLESLHGGRRESLSMDVTNPPRQSRPFAGYVQRVRASATALRASKNQFTKANLRLVIAIARRHDHGLMPLHDLIQEGNIGLMKAVDRFDPERGFRFSTYASWWIRHGINRALANKGRMVRLPAHVSADQLKLARARRELETLHGRAPSVRELAQATGLPAVRVRKLDKVTMQPVVSLDAPVNDDGARTIIDLLADPDSDAPTERLELSAMTDELHDAFEELKPMEIDILRKRFCLDGEDEPVTLRELGEQHSLSRERIRQLQERAINKLRKHFQRRELV